MWQWFRSPKPQPGRQGPRVVVVVVVGATVVVVGATVVVVVGPTVVVVGATVVVVIGAVTPHTTWPAIKSPTAVGPSRYRW